MVRSVVLLVLLLVVVATSVARADIEDDLGNCEERAYDAKSPEPVRIVTYARDAKNHIVSVTTKLSSGTTFVDKYQWDRQGQIATSTMGTSRSIYEYAPKTGKLVQIKNYEGAAKNPHDVWAYNYDSAGHVVRVTQMIDNELAIDKQYSYDASGHLATVKLGDTVETYHYDADGLADRMDEVTSGRKRTFTWTYDAKKRRIRQALSDGHIDYRYDCT